MWRRPRVQAHLSNAGAMQDRVEPCRAVCRLSILTVVQHKLIQQRRLKVLA
uniref:Uncharacterized protein n=1 Tax=Arundo donax TaxID=35708 RepID=A0A0A9AQ59_ARUDO